MFRQLIPGVLCVAMLAGCASSGQGSGAPPRAAPATLDTVMAQADAAVMAGQGEKAYAILGSATSTFPTEKTPWLRMAQMRYDSGRYGEAITNGLEALARDPDDTLANSIVAVSGLRVSSKALADLAHKNNLSGGVRSEAQELARLLRTSLGEEVLVPTPVHTVRRETPRHPGASVPASARAGSASDPFGSLK